MHSSIKSSGIVKLTAVGDNRLMESLYRRHRYLPEIISHAVWLYHRFTLSFRDVEDLLAERGITVTYEAIRSWRRKFGPSYPPGASFQWLEDGDVCLLKGRNLRRTPGRRRLGVINLTMPAEHIALELMTETGFCPTPKDIARCAAATRDQFEIRCECGLAAQSPSSCRP